MHTRKESYLNSQFNMRQNKLKEISKENKQIYNRLNSQKSVYSSQDLNKSYEMRKGLSSSKLSQRSNNSRVSDRSNKSSKSIGRGQRPLVKKKDVKVDIKATNINNVRERDLNKFKGLFSVGNTRTSSEQNRQEERRSISINTFRKNDIYAR